MAKEGGRCSAAGDRRKQCQDSSGDGEEHAATIVDE